MRDAHDDAMITELRELSDRLDVPLPADQRAAVRARLSAPDPVAELRRRIRPWTAAVAAAVVCAVLVTPPARAAVTEAVGGLLRIAGIEVRREPATGALPTAPAPLPSTEPAPLQDARRLARFTIRTPTGLGEPAVTLADPDAGGAPRVVTLTYRGGTVRLDQFDGRLQSSFIKTAPDATYDQVGDRTAIWLPQPHPVTYVDRDGVERRATARLAGPTLIWDTDEVTYRLEGLATLAEAKAVADTLR